MTRRILLSYYAATVLFLLLDYFFGVDIRLAFLDASDTARLAYYSFCLACFAAMLWRPRWTVAIGAFESLITLAAMIIYMALRVMGLGTGTLEPGQDVVTVPEVVNFLISGGIAYVAWARGVAELTRQRL